MNDLKKVALHSLKLRIKSQREYLTTNNKVSTEQTYNNQSTEPTTAVESQNSRKLTIDFKNELQNRKLNFVSNMISRSSNKEEEYMFHRSKEKQSSGRANNNLHKSLRIKLNNEINNKEISPKKTISERSKIVTHNSESKILPINPIKPKRKSLFPSYHLSNKNEENLERKRMKTESLEKCPTRRERIERYSAERLRYPIMAQQKIQKYKNEKLNILVQEYPNIIKSIPDHMKDQNRFGIDISSLVSLFESLPNKEVCVMRHSNQKYRTYVAKLLFFIGYEIYMRYSEDYEAEFKNYEIVLSNYFQIYFSMRLKTPLLVMECYLELIDLALENKKYYECEKYIEKCLLASIFYKEKYYEERCIEKLSMCEYYKGNICEATYLHDNNGNLNIESIKKVKDGYNEREELSIIYYHLYETPKFEIAELLKDYESRNENYKSLIVFNNPRVSIENSMKNKKDQLKIDIRSMERVLEFKSEAYRIKKELEKHENLFDVNRVNEIDSSEFKLIKRNLVLDEENESSQILRAHQSLNRVKEINLKPIYLKLSREFVSLLKIIDSKLNQ